MNERIRELVQHAVLAVDIVTGNEALDDELAKMYIPDCFAEKFAELIVKECMTTILKESKWYWDKDEFESSNAVQNAARRVKEHFGVEQ